MQDAAADGEPQAMRHLGQWYSWGELLPEDGALALKWMQKAADADDLVALRTLGTWYLEGMYVAEDEDKAYACMLAAAEGGDSFAKLYLAKFYRNGWGTPVDAQKAVKWLQEASDEGELEATALLAEWYLEGDFIPKDSAKAFALCKVGAEAGDADCACALGEAYLFGEGTAANFAQGKEWLEAAAEGGSVRAMHRLSVAYDGGEHGFPKDPEQAFRWLLMNCQNSDDKLGSYLLAIRYLEGDGTSENPEEAFYWLDKSVELGCHVALLDLAEFYAKGCGTPRNPEKARACLAEARSLGVEDVDSTEAALARYLAQGEAGADPDNLDQQHAYAVNHIRLETEKCLAMLENAAEKGHAPSRYYLYTLYSTGRDRKGDAAIIPINQENARYWLEKSAANFDRWAVLQLSGNYNKGTEGYPKNDEMAFYWKNQMLEHNPNDSVMQVLVGLAYLDGRGVARDVERGIALIRQSANAGEGYAQDRLGAIYHNGIYRNGVPIVGRDLRQAERWLEQAIQNGWEKAGQELEQVRRELRQGR